MNMRLSTICNNFVVRTDSVNQYLKEINNIYPYTAQEEKEMFEKYYAADDEESKTAIRNEIILHNQRFVYAIAKRYSTNDILCDLISCGNLGLMQAFDSFDCTKGFRFYTYAAYYVQRAINAYFTNEHLMVKPTNNARISSKVKAIKNEYFLKNGKEPSNMEIINILGEKYNIFITDPEDVCGVHMEYINSSVSDDEDANTFEDSSEWNEVTASVNDYENAIEDDSLSYAMSEALKVLDDREKSIVMLSSGIGTDRPLKDKEIAEKLGFSSERIRQLRKKAISKMRMVYTANA